MLCVYHYLYFTFGSSSLFPVQTFYTGTFSKKVHQGQAAAQVVEVIRHRSSLLSRTLVIYLKDSLIKSFEATSYFTLMQMCIE